MLKPDGKLVALCANGPRQQKEFRDKGEYWEVLPEGSFKSEGTMVSVALVVLYGPGSVNGEAQSAEEMEAASMLF